MLSVPLLTLGQSTANPAGLPESSSSAMAAAAAPALPDAPQPAVGQSTQQNQQQPPGKTQPDSNAPSLGDLGFSTQQTEANAKLQARLNQRTHMLKVHQTLGLITVAPLVATVIASGGAKQKHTKGPNSVPVEPSSSGVDLHVALGSASVAMYGLTAYYAIAAPKIAGVKPKGAIRLHRDLVWIHLPGMVLTPVLGAMALNQENQNEKIHGIASAHAYVAWTTVAAYGASIVAVSWPLHLKFWEHP